MDANQVASIIGNVKDSGGDLFIWMNDNRCVSLYFTEDRKHSWQGQNNIDDPFKGGNQLIVHERWEDRRHSYIIDCDTITHIQISKSGLGDDETEGIDYE